MTRPWTRIERAATRDGELELRQRDSDDFLLTLAGRVLMSSRGRRSEEALGARAAAAVRDREAPRLLVSGLGMGFTLRAALDSLGSDARVTVVELYEDVVRWCRGPLAAVSGRALADPRVDVRTGDVAAVISEAARAGGVARFDAIVLDLFEGPHAASDARDDPFYGRRALERTHRALTPGGVLAVWCEDPDRAFERRLGAAGFRVERTRPGRGGRRHAIYVAVSGARA